LVRYVDRHAIDDVAIAAGLSCLPRNLPHDWRIKMEVRGTCASQSGQTRGGQRPSGPA